MLSIEKAKEIGILACIEKIGIEFCKKYKENMCISCGLKDDGMYCSIGIDDEPYIPKKNPQKLILTENRFKYFASCNVDIENEIIKFLECTIP